MCTQFMAYETGDILLIALCYIQLYPGAFGSAPVDDHIRNLLRVNQCSSHTFQLNQTNVSTLQCHLSAPVLMRKKLVSLHALRLGIKCSNLLLFHSNLHLHIHLTELWTAFNTGQIFYVKTFSTFICV